MRIGASTGALYPKWLTEDAVDALAGLGFPVVEVVLQTAGEYEAAYAGALARRARGAGVAVHAVHSFTQLHPLFDPYPRRRAEGRAALLRGIEAAATLGARCLVWHGLTLRDQRAGVGWEAFREELADLCAVARPAGVTLALENVSWCAVRDAEAARRVRAWGLPLGFAFDPFQAAEAGADAAGLLQVMAGALVDVHLSDHAAGGPRHLLPGEGDLDWPALLAGVRATGYDGPLMIEGPCAGRLDRLVRSRDFLEALLAEP